MGDLLRISGDEAARYDAVDLSSFCTVNTGILKLADVSTGEVSWADATGNVISRKLGDHMIRIVRKGR